MRYSISSSLTALLIGAVVTVTAAFGQSLSIKKSATNYWIEASAPAGNPHTLQSSPNLLRWMDINSDVQAQFSYTLTNAGSTQRFFRLIPTPPPAPPIRVLLIGDSMAADCCGWGGGIYGYFKPNATVINYAMPWTSTTIFLQSAEYEKMLLIKPDYVLIQYGFIDGGTDTNRSTTLEEFETNLKTIVNTVRGFDGFPILITLHAARLWENGKLITSWEHRNNITKKVAAEMNTPLIDFYETTWELFNRLGPSGTEYMQWNVFGPGDFMHFSPQGAIDVCPLIINELPDSLSPYLILDPAPKP
jgi:lysophospholipase L1-like esterase